MLRFLRLFFALLLSQILLGFLCLFGLIVVLAARHGAPMLEKQSLLWLQLSGEIIEYPTLPVVPLLHEKPLSQSLILEALDDAAEDARIDVVLVEMDTPGIGWGKATELREAILRYRQSGKQAWAYAPVLDEIDLYLATACDSIFVPPTGALNLNGIGFGAMYFKGALDKLGVKANVSRIGDYKTAPETNLRNDMSPEEREQSSWLLDGIWSEFVEMVSLSRGIPTDVFEEVLDEGILLPEEAVDLGIIDALAYRSDLTERFVDQDGYPRLISVMDYDELRAQRRKRSGPAVAVVHTRGLILRGRNSYVPSLGTILGAGSVVHDLEDALADEDIAAIVLRIDSGGGEIIASDIISNAVERARQIKPIVVSMVDVAASGGYMMSYPASRIVAMPTTITGSIGIYSTKLNLRGLYNKLGIHKDFVTRGAYPFLYSDYRDWSAPEESLVTRQQWASYDRWIAGIADQRNLKLTELDEIAGGRVWTGRQALEHGLVDAVGDQRLAIEMAKNLASLPGEESVRLVHYPKPRGLWSVLFEDSDLLLAGALEKWAHSLSLPRDVVWSVLDSRVSR